MFDVVNTISASGGGLPTEKAVNALKNAGYQWARVKQNRTGGYCGSDIDLSLLNEGKQVKLIDLCTFWSSSRIDIISITQHAPEVTGGDFIFYKVSITISGTSATYALKNSGETETLIVQARK